MKTSPDPIAAARRELQAARAASKAFAERIAHLDAARRHLSDMRAEIQAGIQALASFGTSQSGQLALLSMLNRAIEECMTAVRSLDAEIRRAEVDILFEIERRMRPATLPN